MPTVQQEVAPQWTTYLDVQNDVMPWLQFGVVPEAAVEVKLQSITNMACQWAQGYLNKPIAPTKFFRRFSGWTGFNGAYLCLPYYPVIEVESCVEYWGTSGPHILTEQTPANQGSTGS